MRDGRRRPAIWAGPFGFGLGNRLGQPNHKSGPAQTTNKFDLFRKIIILSKHQSKIKNPN